MASVQRGVSPDRSIHEFTVVRLRFVNITGFRFFAALTISVALILHPASFAVSIMIDQVAGPCQLWYLAGAVSLVALRPCGFLTVCLIFFFSALAGQVSSAMDVRRVDMLSVSSNSLRCKVILSLFI